MRKDEHLKIVSKLEEEIQILQKRISELSSENSKLSLDLEVKKFQCEQKDNIINDMLLKNIKNLNYMIEYDKKFKEYTQQLNYDNQKLDELVNYIKSDFSYAIMEQNKESDSIDTPSTDGDLSQTFIGENGQIYVPYHVIDLAILIMKTQKKKLKEILGDEGFNINNDEE